MVVGNKELDDFRREINDIDRKIIEYLEKRARIARDIGEYKKSHGIPVRDWEREQVILDKLSKKDLELLDGADLVKIYKEIMGTCRHLENLEETVGYLGPPGTFCEIAAREYFSDAGTIFQPFESKWELFRALG
ncbi:hypothetical protein GF325_08180, partial [Candidatus Bathyarchaeota archaeon]|nr:hypothetical protein [Candidatus Bathyarchaeota archaeon]